ncbi:ABC transporter permease [Virgibacillus halophilus]|uniref:Transport permease protein n=2 Tax=Tigheibacillus halophilus TaxID=361280 RepID=A0ABU5C7N7_9BACI|nr:ABC transporter permease [Virgibacillus halophilus]
MPMIGIIVAFVAYGDQNSQSLSIGIIDHDRQPITAETIDYLKQMDHVDMKVLKDKEMQDALTSGHIDGAITFDHGYADSILAQKPAHVTITSIKGESVTGFVKSMLYQYMDQLTVLSEAADGDTHKFTALYKDYQQAEFQLQTTAVEDTSVDKGMTYTAVGFLIMIMLLSASNLAEIILKEKEERTYFRLLSTPITAKQFMIANTLVNLMVMIVQAMLTLLILTKGFDISLGVVFWKAAVVMILFALISVGLSLTIVAFSGSRNAVSALSNLIIMPTVMLSGCFWPVEIMPKTAQKISEFLPQRWALETLTQLQEGSKIGDLYLNFLILIAFALVFFLIATYKFSRNNNINSFS